VLHMTKAATVTETDRGEFSALVSTYDLDRQGERVAPGAFSRTIRDWRSTGRMIPLHWDHSSDPEDIVGHVDPANVAESEAGLVVQGKVDLETDRGREAWRLLKSNSVGFSFGYMVTKSHDADGVGVLDEIDLYEVTITPSPANNHTRVLDLKSAHRNGEDDLVGLFNSTLSVPPTRVDAFDEEFYDREFKAQERAYAERLRKSRPIKVKTFKV
jgi:HK97 family phage prohead protease